MAPPSALDPWLHGRHFGIVIDAGSSGSRLQIYSWINPRSITLEKGSDLSLTLPVVGKGTQHGEDWVHKVEPGISSFANNPEGVEDHLKPLLNHARKHIPPSLEKETPIFLLATAGMRLLSPIKQAKILEESCRFLTHHSTFKIDSPTAAGPCGSSVRIITGEEEGLFGWIAVNYLMNGFTGPGQNRTTYGFLDMGGASTQIAFEPDPRNQGDAKNLVDVRLRLLGGAEINHKVFVTTWLGYGTNQARERYVGKAISEFEGTRTKEQPDIVPDPCLPKNLRLHETPVGTLSPTAHASQRHQLQGTGSFEQCMQNTASLLNKNAPCPDTHCLMNGIYVPPIDFSVSHFIGVSEYWYSSEHIFGLGGAYDFVQYERAASEFCSKDWAEILKEHDKSRKNNQLGGDGEVEVDGQIVDAGKWEPNIERSRLQMQCFKAAWVANVLHEGIGIPRIVDLGGNVTSGAEKVVKEAEKKGLGSPTFQSLDTVGDIAISWTLGKMVLEASKEIPLASKSDRPLVDPIDDVPANSPIQPIRPFYSLDSLEDRIAPHLPTVLTRTSLGFSPVIFLALVSFSCLLILLAYPLRRHFRSSCLRSIRRVTKGGEVYSLEEGTYFHHGKHLSGSRIPSPTSAIKPWLNSLRRILSFSRATAPLHNPNSRHTDPPSRASPTRSYSLPNGFDTTASSTQYTRSSISRSSSPVPGFIDDTTTTNNHMPQNLSSRSRNTSQMNLSIMVPRPSALSRIGSFQSPQKALQDE